MKKTKKTKIINDGIYFPYLNKFFKNENFYIYDFEQLDENKDTPLFKFLDYYNFNKKMIPVFDHEIFDLLLKKSNLLYSINKGNENYNIFNKLYSKELLKKVNQKIIKNVPINEQNLTDLIQFIKECYATNEINMFYLYNDLFSKKDFQQICQKYNSFDEPNKEHINIKTDLLTIFINYLNILYRPNYEKYSNKIPDDFFNILKDESWLKDIKNFMQTPIKLYGNRELTKILLSKFNEIEVNKEKKILNNSLINLNIKNNKQESFKI